MIPAVRLEFFKSRRRGLLLTVLALFGFEIAWMFMAFRNPTAQEIQQGWKGLLYQMPTLNTIFFPIAAAIVASRLADLEHKGETWKLLETIQDAKDIFMGKFLCGAWYVLLSIILETGAMLLCGKLLAYDGSPDLEKYMLFLVFQFVTALEIFALQLILSSLIRNQMIPLCIGCGGCFIGLLLLFVPLKAAQYILPWGHSSLLYIVYLVYWNADQRTMLLAYNPIHWAAFVVAICELVVFLWIGCKLFHQKEV